MILKNMTKIEIVGLMTMAPLTDDEAYIRSLFKQLRLKKRRNTTTQFRICA